MKGQLLKIIYLSTSDIVKLPGNTRKNKDPKAIERLAKLIKAHGFQNPLQVYAENGKYTIIAGNHRFDAGLSLGMKEFPCIVYTGDKKAALARAISDNRSSEWTEWDMPILKELFIELDSGDFDIHLTGFNRHELELMMTATFQGDPPMDDIGFSEGKKISGKFTFFEDSRALLEDKLKKLEGEIDGFRFYF
jgi:hypothetical protein